MNLTKEELLHNIYNETYSDILKYIISKCRNIEDAYDIIQNTYFNFYKAMDHINIENSTKYLFKIAKNELFKTYGILGTFKNNVALFSIDNNDSSINNENLISTTNFDSNLICEEIYLYLKNRDTLTFKIFLLYYKFDMKIIDISKKLHISESTVKNRLYRTTKELQKIFN